MKLNTLLFLSTIGCSTGISGDADKDSIGDIPDSVDGDPTDETPDEETPDEEVPDDETPDEETPDEEAPDEETPDEEVPDEETPDEEAPDEETPPPDLSLAGPSSVYATSGSLVVSDGCNVQYERYTPYEPTTAGEVFFLHGFMRSKDEFTGIAEHLSTWGIAATSVTMCHSSFIDVQPEQNAADVVELADALGAEDVVWVGHSNGGISALIAGNIAPDLTSAVLGLDPVESTAGGGEAWASTLSVPVASLFGESDSCNDSNSGLPIYEMTSAVDLLRVTEADHCSFEAPTGWLCTLTCGRTKSIFTDSYIASTITELTTAWAKLHLEPSFDATPWWSETGSVRQELEDVGAISSL